MSERVSAGVNEDILLGLLDREDLTDEQIADELAKVLAGDDSEEVLRQRARLAITGITYEKVDPDQRVETAKDLLSMLGLMPGQEVDEL